MRENRETSETPVVGCGPAKENTLQGPRSGPSSRVDGLVRFGCAEGGQIGSLHAINPRWGPCAVAPQARACAGGGGQPPSLPQPEFFFGDTSCYLLRLDLNNLSVLEDYCEIPIYQRLCVPERDNPLGLTESLENFGFRHAWINLNLLFSI